MTPRVNRADPVTWDGIENMMNEAIALYDERRIVPREEDIIRVQREEHSANTATLKQIEKMLYVWSILGKVAMAMLTVILVGVAGLVFDFLKWGFANHWRW